MLFFVVQSKPTEIYFFLSKKRPYFGIVYGGTAGRRASDFVCFPRVRAGRDQKNFSRAGSAGLTKASGGTRRDGTNGREFRAGPGGKKWSA